MNGRSRAQLFALLHEQFDLSELRALAFELQIEHENLSGNSRRDFARSFVEFAERHGKVDELWTLVDRKRPFRGNDKKEAKMGRVPTETLKWASIILGLIAAVITIGLWLSSGHDRILLTVQVNSSIDQSVISNAKVTLDLPGEIIPPEVTDANGRAVFSLRPEADSNLARLTIETNGQVKTQTVSVYAGMGTVAFQMQP